MSEWVQILKELSEASGVPGQEQEVRELMRTYLEPYTEELSTDNLGSIVGRKTGTADGPKIMVQSRHISPLPVTRQKWSKSRKCISILGRPVQNAPKN